MSDFDPLQPETFDSPHEVYRRLRNECPVAHTDAWGGFWALTKHADVSKAAIDYETFVNSKQNVIPKVAFTGRRPPLHLDPPEHTPYRRAISPLLTPRKVERLRPVIHDICASLLQPLIDRGEGDICTEFSSRMPVLVFASWMNLPQNQVEQLGEVGRQFNVAVQSNDIERTKESSLLLYDMARKLVADRKERPLDPETDVTSSLLSTRIDGEPLPEDMIIGMIRQVLVVGIIAPTVLIGSICVHLSRDPELQDQLRTSPELIPAAVDEFLRLYTPYRGFARTAVHDVEFRGRIIPAGEPIALVYASANRDEEVFEKADQFQLNRPNLSESIHFGKGPHHCPGASLARLELAVALEELLARTSHFELAGEPVQTRMPEVGALHVPLKFERAEAE